MVLKTKQSPGYLRSDPPEYPSSTGPRLTGSLKPAQLMTDVSEEEKKNRQEDPDQRNQSNMSPTYGSSRNQTEAKRSEEKGEGPDQAAARFHVAPEDLPQGPETRTGSEMRRFMTSVWFPGCCSQLL